jgi:hypothetical protein
MIMKNDKKKIGFSPMKKVISAAGMLAVSASMLATSTYAWFSMNKTVTATGMQVTAKSNNTFLLINTGDNDEADEIQTAGLTTIPVATISDTEAQVYPSKPKESTEIGEGKRFTTGTPVTNATTAATAANWYTAQNNNPGDSNDSVKNITSLNTTANDPFEFSQYVIKRTVYLTLADGSNAAHLLTVTPSITDADTNDTPDDISAVKVLVATGDNYVILDSSMTTAQSLSTVDFTITDQTSIPVDIYLYYDGEEAAVYTNNIADLAKASVTLTFDVEVGSAS